MKNEDKWRKMTKKEIWLHTQNPRRFQGLAVVVFYFSDEILDNFHDFIFETLMLTPAMQHIWKKYKKKKKHFVETIKKQKKLKHEREVTFKWAIPNFLPTEAQQSNFHKRKPHFYKKNFLTIFSSSGVCSDDGKKEKQMCGMRWTREISWAVVHAMSRVRNTQSRAQDTLTQQQGNGKTGTWCAGQLSHISHCVDRNSHMWTQLEGIGTHWSKA